MEQTNYVVMVAGIVEPGKDDYAKQYFQHMADEAKSDPGCLVYNIQQSLSNSCEFMMYSIWENKEAFEMHNQKPEMQEYKQSLNKLLLEDQSRITEWALL
jgi:quinol monooxygenase YgiN